MSTDATGYPQLKPCPSCGFDRDAYDEHVRRMGGRTGPWESYSPRLMSMFGGCFIDCQSCGFIATWCESDKSKTIELWNKLPREAERFQFSNSITM